MELLKGYDSSVEFITPAGLTREATLVTVKTSSGSTIEVNQSKVSVNGNRTTIQLPYKAVHEAGEISVSLVFYFEDGEFVLSESFTVATPIMALHEVAGIIEEPENSQTTRTIEAAVRHIIQAHCGQEFGRVVGPKSITGSDEGYLKLPSRLLGIKTINKTSIYNQTFAVRGNGWYLVSKGGSGVPSLRADFDGWHQTPYGGPTTVAPYASKAVRFSLNQEYVIDGIWGWESVPDAVREAAKLLINDYACADSAYRDRFVSSMSAADWRVQFHEGAYSNTGNVRANQLLSAYVVPHGWVVI